MGLDTLPGHLPYTTKLDGRGGGAHLWFKLTLVTPGLSVPYYVIVP